MQCYCQKCGAIHDEGNRKSVWWKYAPPCRYCGGTLGPTKKPAPKPKLPSRACPICNGPMAVRRSRDGHDFLGCKRFPDCRGTRNVGQQAGHLETVVVTDELIQQGASITGSWSREQLAILGVPWPPPAGWKRRCIGSSLEKSMAEKFVAMASVRRGKNLDRREQQLCLEHESLEQWRARMIAADTSTEPPFDPTPEIYQPECELDREFAEMFR